MKLGQRVKITGTAKKDKGYESYSGGRFLTTYVDGPLPKIWNRDGGTMYDEGVIVGRRTVQDGETRYEYDGLPVFKQTIGTAKPVWLVAFDLRYKPVMCFEHQVEPLKQLPPLVMKAGTYRNSLGAEMVLTKPAVEGGPRTLGEMWWAELRDSLFPMHWLVTAQGLHDAGYEWVEETK